MLRLRRAVVPGRGAAGGLRDVLPKLVLELDMQRGLVHGHASGAGAMQAMRVQIQCDSTAGYHGFRGSCGPFVKCQISGASRWTDLGKLVFKLHGRVQQGKQSLAVAPATHLRQV